MSLTRAEFVRGAVAASVSVATGILSGCGNPVGKRSPAPMSEDDGTFLVDVTEPADAPVLSDVTAGGDAQRQDGFVVLQDYLPDMMADIRYIGTYNFVGMRIDGYEEPLAILSKEAADALRMASDEAVSRGYRLKVYDGYRPQRAVAHFCRWAEDAGDTRMKPYFYPELDKPTLFARGYVAERSGHSRGSTVDITLFDMASGRDADMGGTFDWFGELSHPDYRAGVSDEQYANRMALRDIMTGVGFEPVSNEWWHFCLADEPYPDTYFDFPVSYDSLAAPRG